MKHTILIAEDDIDVLHLIGRSFVNEGFSILELSNGSVALDQMRSQAPALAILDLAMPGLNGFEVIRALKRDKQTALIPVILLSGHADEANRVLGLELGADDFVRKPFSPRELVLRSRAILERRRPPLSPSRQLLRGRIVLDQDRCAALVSGLSVPLTVVEFKLLSYLALHAGRVLQRESLLEQIWGNEAGIDVRTVDTNIRRLRDKLGPAASQVVTVRGFGYRLDESEP